MAKISKISKPGRNTVYTKSYQSFLGVDFSKEASMVDDRRSPDARNIISDTDGFPEKRVGWRTLRKFDGRINGIFTFGDMDNPCTIIHAGTEIYKLQYGETTQIYTGCADNCSCGKYFKGKLCILTGSEFLVFDGEKCIRAGQSEEVYAPITHIQRGTMESGGIDEYPSDSDTFNNWIKSGTIPAGMALGAVPEGSRINLVSGRRKNTFEWDGTKYPMFVLDEKIDLGTRVVMRCITTGQTIFDIVYKTDAAYEDGYYSPDDGLSAEHKALITSRAVMNNGHPNLYVVIGNSEKNRCGYVLCRPNTSKLTGYVYTPGVDNFSIEFSHEIEGYAERIDRCRFMDVFENRIFFSGNPDYPNADWYSGVNDPLFVPDINYTEIGLDSSEIMGYLRTGNEQAILKSDGDGSTIYMRRYQNLSDGSVIFPVSQGIGGLGAVSRSMATFLDDPLYITRNGVYAIALQDISSERALNIRSTRINRKLLLEKNLDQAIMCEWEGYLLVCINGKCFVADAAQKTYSGNKTGTYEYEWYYWTNIPARVFGNGEGVLYFGTEDGKLCRFNNDLVNERGELSSHAYSDDGAAICAVWSTPLSDDGDFMQEKTMVKSGSGVFLKAYNRSGVSVCIRTDSEFEREIRNKSAGIFNFEDIDFSDFTFNTSPYTVVPFNTKVKNYKAIQVICKNEKPNHAFGIGGITRKYFYGKTYK